MSFITSLGDWLRKISRSFSDVSVNGQNIVLTRHNGDTTTITTQDTNTTYNPASQSADGLMSATDKVKLDGITAGAEPNQNAFSNIKVGATTIAADGKTGTFEFVAGSNITLTPDATNDTITIAATDTVTTVTSSGSGNAVTSITANDGALTVEKHSTFSLSDHTHEYLPLSGGTITGSIVHKSTAIRGTAPSADISNTIMDIVDKNNVRYGLLNMYYATNKSSEMRMFAYDTTVASGNNIGRLGIGCTSNGKLYTIAPTPPTNDNSTQIATTEYVRNFAYPKSGGALTYSDIYRSEGNSRLFLSGGSAWNTGSQLWLQSKEVGTGITLAAMGTNGAIKSLEIKPDGTFNFDGKPITVIHAHSIGNDSGYIKFSDGLQLVWGMTGVTNTGTAVTFARAFASGSTPRVVFGECPGSVQNVVYAPTAYPISATGMTVYQHSVSGKTNGNCSYIAIGKGA